jgi:hypothetical protein
VPGGGVYCGKVVCQCLYSVLDFIDSIPELFCRPLHSPVDLLVPLLYELREPGLLLAALAGYAILATDGVELVRFTPLFLGGPPCSASSVAACRSVGIFRTQ